MDDYVTLMSEHGARNAGIDPNNSEFLPVTYDLIIAHGQRIPANEKN